MSPFWMFLSIILILVLLPAVWRLLDEPIDWSRYSLPHHAARLARRAATQRRARPPDPGHEHVWHHIATCKCGTTHTYREPSTP